jgi:hypothetical protein
VEWYFAEGTRGPGPGSRWPCGARRVSRRPSPTGAKPPHRRCPSALMPTTAALARARLRSRMSPSPVAPPLRARLGMSNGLALSTGLLPLPVDPGPQLNNAVPSVQSSFVHSIFRSNIWYSIPSGRASSAVKNRSGGSSEARR